MTIYCKIVFRLSLHMLKNQRAHSWRADGRRATDVGHQPLSFNWPTGALISFQRFLLPETFCRKGSKIGTQTDLCPQCRYHGPSHLTATNQASSTAICWRIFSKLFKKHVGSLVNCLTLWNKL